MEWIALAVLCVAVQRVLWFWMLIIGWVPPPDWIP